MARTPPLILGSSDLRPANRRRRKRPRRVRAILRRLAIVAGGLAALALIVGALTAVVGIGVARDARDGREAFNEARSALVRQETDVADAAFERARVAFASADQRLRGATAFPLRVLPLLDTHGEALRSMARSGALAAQAGRVASDAVATAPSWGLRQGRVDLAPVQRASGFMRDAVGFGERALGELDAAPEGWLVGPVADALAEADELLTGAIDGLRGARDGLEALPILLGGEGTQRYLVAFANLAELRGTGGFIGFYTLAEAADGRIVHIDEAGRPTEELGGLDVSGVDVPSWFEAAYGRRYGATTAWQNVNMSIDFPTPARIMASGAEEGLGPLDGVIQVDPVAIAAFLRLTGPVRVDVWPTEITADNVEEIVQHRQYVTFDTQVQRTALSNQLIDAAFDRLLAADLELSPSLLTELGRVVRGGHLKIHSADERAQRGLEGLGMGGSVGRADDATDVLSVVTENAAGNKIDWFLRREVVYRVSLDPEDGTATTELTATLANKAPPRGLPRYVIGPFSSDLSAGMNRQIAVVLRPWADEITSFELGGEVQEGVVKEAEGDYRTYHAGVVMGPGERNQLLMTSEIPGALEGSGAERTYRLDVLAHPSAHEDFYDIQIVTPAGWTATGASSFLGTLDGDITLEVTLRKTARARFVDTFLLGPLGWLGDLF